MLAVLRRGVGGGDVLELRAFSAFLLSPYVCGAVLALDLTHHLVDARGDLGLRGSFWWSGLAEEGTEI